MVIAELVPAVDKWNMKHLGELSNHPLKDNRVTIFEGDVAKILKKEKEIYDAILLDVDNGPDGLTRKENNWLYSRKGLGASFAALRPDGLLSVWSVTPDEAFTKLLHQTGFKVEEVSVRSKGRHGSARHTIWIAEK